MTLACDDIQIEAHSLMKWLFGCEDFGNWSFCFYEVILWCDDVLSEAHSLMNWHFWCETLVIGNFTFMIWFLWCDVSSSWCTNWSDLFDVLLILWGILAAGGNLILSKIME